MANGLQWPLWRERSPLTGLLVHFELLASSNANTDQNRERRTMELEKHQCFSCTRISFDSWSFWEHSGGYELVGYGCRSEMLLYVQPIFGADQCESINTHCSLSYMCRLCCVQLSHNHKSVLRFWRSATTKMIHSANTARGGTLKLWTSKLAEDESSASY